MEAPPVVLLHGMWSSGSTLDALRRVFEARGHRVLAPTLPLHPARNAEELTVLGRLSLLDYARHLEEAILAARLPLPPILVGHSMGGLLAQILAARLSTRAVVLLAPAPPAGVHAVRWSNLVATRNVITKPSFWRRAHRPPDALAEWGLLHGVPEPRRSEIRAALIPESGRAYAEIVFWWLDRAGAARVDPAQVRCPLLVVGGADDRVIPASVVRRTAALYGQSELVMLPGRGHWFFEEPGAAELFARLECWLDLACAATQPNGEPAPPRRAPLGNAPASASARLRSSARGPARARRRGSRAG
jgi:pimeloyl-ACP methyl ester carboxylesterase